MRRNLQSLILLPVPKRESAEIHTYSPQGKDDDPEEKNEAANTDQKSDEGLSPDQTKDPLQHDADKGSPEHPQANGQASDPSSDTALVPVSSEVQKGKEVFLLEKALFPYKDDNTDCLSSAFGNGRRNRSL